MRALNIGCGSTFHSSWTNVDLVSSDPEVESYDIRQGLPYPDNTFDACYSSHVLEHLTKASACHLLKECFRVLKPFGIVRVVVPDLEKIAELYLEKLEQVKLGITEAEADYDWIMLELYDQAVRQVPGGEIFECINTPDLKNKEFIRSRLGTIVGNSSIDFKQINQQSLWQKIIVKNPVWFVNKVRSQLTKTLVLLLAGQEAKIAFEDGLFRHSGEIHYWMYDSFSLKRMLKSSGFIEISSCKANQSHIPEFNSYNLDIDDGLVRIPQSLYMEGVKPLDQTIDSDGKRVPKEK